MTQQYCQGDNKRLQVTLSPRLRQLTQNLTKTDGSIETWAWYSQRFPQNTSMVKRKGQHLQHFRIHRWETCGMWQIWVDPVRQCCHVLEAPCVRPSLPCPSLLFLSSLQWPPLHVRFGQDNLTDEKVYQTCVVDDRVCGVWAAYQLCDVTDQECVVVPCGSLCYPWDLPQLCLPHTIATPLISWFDKYSLCSKFEFPVSLWNMLQSLNPSNNTCNSV